MILHPDREKERGSRLDLFIRERLKGLSRARVQSLIRDGRIRVSGRVMKPSYRITGSEEICVELPPKEEERSILPEPIPLKIHYEDEFIAVVEKEAGIVTHPTFDLRSGTLVNALLFHIGHLSSISGETRKGIVHRLDRETSGLLVVAKTDDAHLSIKGQFSSRLVKKEYDAIVAGDVRGERGVISKPIGRDRRRPILISTRTGAPKPAETGWRVVSRAGPITHLKVLPASGRTHQIRVHLSSIGHPVLGDRKYFRKGHYRNLPQEIVDIMTKAGRHLLHASRIGFHHPLTGGFVEFSSPPPPLFHIVMEEARRVFSG